MSHPDPADLAKVPLFEGLSDDERSRLALWLEVEDFGVGRKPTHDRNAGYVFFIVAEGEAHAEHNGKVLSKLEPGDVFGEMAFFDPAGRRNADVVPDTAIRVYSMFGTHFREMQMQMPNVAARLEQLVIERAAQLRALEGQA